MDGPQPTIKGVFVKSHIEALRKSHGDNGVAELEKLMEKPLTYGNNQDIPIREEVKLIEHVLNIMTDNQVPEGEREYEAGRLHFRNFVSTPLARIMFPLFQNQFKILMLNISNIAGHVFKNVGFESYSLGATKVKVVMHNNDYPIDHFRGLFQEWLEYAGHTGIVTAERTDHRYEYTITWT